MPKKKTYHHGDLKNALIKAGVDILVAGNTVFSSADPKAIIEKLLTSD